MNNNLLKYFSGELSRKERSLLLQQIENDENLKKDFINILNIYSVSQLSFKNDDKINGKKSFNKLIVRLKRKHRSKQLRRVLKYAAVASILIISTVLTTLHLGNQYSSKVLNTLFVPAGQRARITLEDGTEIWLNAQSILTYPSKFSRKNRTVEIEGEAFFDVAEDGKRPFIVNTHDIVLEVLGTQFNIHSYKETNYVETLLVEGSLKVSENLNNNNTVNLRPNEQVLFKDGNLIVTPISNSDYLLWREGIYSFNNEKLIEIIKKLELYYDVKIYVEDPQIFNVKYTGKFRQRDGIDEILRILQIIQPFEIEKDILDNSITLSKKN